MLPGLEAVLPRAMCVLTAKAGGKLAQALNTPLKKAITNKAIKFQTLYLEQAVRRILLRFLMANRYRLNLLTLD
jgi:hypothetical protein